MGRSGRRSASADGRDHGDFVAVVDDVRALVCERATIHKDIHKKFVIRHTCDQRPKSLQVTSSLADHHALIEASIPVKFEALAP